MPGKAAICFSVKRPQTRAWPPEPMPTSALSIITSQSNKTQKGIQMIYFVLSITLQKGKENKNSFSVCKLSSPLHPNAIIVTPCTPEKRKDKKRD